MPSAVTQGVVGVILGVILCQSITIIGLSARLIDWVHNLSPSEYQTVEEVLHNARFSLRIGFAFSLCALTSVILALLCRESIILPSLTALVWVIAIVLGLVFLGKTSWTPISAICHLSPTIPHAKTTCGQIFALNVLIALNVIAMIGIVMTLFIFMAKPKPQPALNPAGLRPMSARNSQSGAPAEYDLENLTFSSAGAKVKPTAEDFDTGAGDPPRKYEVME